MMPNMNMLKFSRKDFVRDLSHGKLLTPHLDKFAGYDEPWEFKYKSKEKDDAWHPSGDCMPSAVDLYAQTQSKGRRNFSTSLQRSFMVGHFWHQLLEHIICHELEFCE